MSDPFITTERRELHFQKGFPTFPQAAEDEDWDVPNIAKDTERAGHLLMLAFFSGVLSSASIFTGGWAILWAPGIIFSGMVMLPWCRWIGTHPMVTFWTVLATPFGYYAAVNVFCCGGVLALGAGAVGSAIMLAPVLLAGPDCIWRSAAPTVLIGGLMGLLFLALPCVFFGLIGLWQFVVGLGLMLALREGSFSDYLHS